MGREKKPRGKVKLGSMNHHSSWVPPPPPRLGTAGAPATRQGACSAALLDQECSRIIIIQNTLTVLERTYDPYYKV